MTKRLEIVFTVKTSRGGLSAPVLFLDRIIAVNPFDVAPLRTYTVLLRTIIYGVAGWLTFVSISNAYEFCRDFSAGIDYGDYRYLIDTATHGSSDAVLVVLLLRYDLARAFRERSEPASNPRWKVSFPRILLLYFCLSCAGFAINQLALLLPRTSMVQGVYATLLTPERTFATATAMLVAVIAFVDDRRRLRLNARSVAGHCLACGYDLRESPTRCPECGRPTE